MGPTRIRNFDDGPERKIQNDLIDFLKIRDWYVMETHGNMYQRGFPDLFICHYKYGARWVEVKNAASYSFTPAQLECFPRISQGSGVWILVGATETEYNKLFGPANWHVYLHLLSTRA